MAAETSSGERDPILRKIDSIRRSTALWTLGWGLLLVLLLVTTLIFAGVLLDHAVVLQKWGRLTFFHVFVFCSGAALLAAGLFPLLRRISRLYVAGRIERENPDLRNSLISYLQCRDDPRTGTELKRLMGRKSAAAVRTADATVAVDRSRYWRTAAIIGLLAALFLLYWALSPKSARVSIARLIRPRADIHPPTATRLERIEPGDVYAVRGDRPDLSVTVGGVAPQSVHAVWQVGGRERRLLLAKDEQGRWRSSFPPLLESGSYYVVAGDTRSNRFEINVLPKPVVEDIELRIRPPAYTGLPERTVRNADIEVPAGTKVGVVVRTSLPPERGRLEFESGRRTPLEPSADGATLATELTVLRSDAYTVHFQSVRYPDGSTFRNPSPVRYRIVSRKDRPPEVRLLGPPDRAEFAAEDTVPIRYSASDDYGVESINLRYSVSGYFAPAGTIAEPGSKRVREGVYEWELTSIPARPGQVISYYLEARDNRPNTPGTSRSEVRRIAIEGGRRTGTTGDGRRQTPPPGEDEREPRDEDGDRGPEESRRREGQAPQPERDEETGPAERRSEQPDRSGTREPESAAPRETRRDREPGALDRLAERLRSIHRRLIGQPGAGDSTPQGREGTEPEAGPSPQQPAAGSGGREPRPEPAGASPEERPDGGGAAGRERTAGAEAGDRGTGSQGPAGRRQERTGGAEAGGGESSGAPSESGRDAGDGSEPSPDGRPSDGDRQGAGGAQPGGEQPSGGGRQPGGAGAGRAEDGSGSEPAGGGGAGAEDALGGEGRSAPAGQGGRGAGGTGATGRDGTGAEGPTAGQAAASGASPGGGEGATDAAGSGGGGGAGTGVERLPAVERPEGRLPTDRLEADRAARELDQMLEENRVPDRKLRELGLNRQKLREFIERYRERRRSEKTEQPPSAVEERPGRLLRGAERAAGEVEVSDARPEKPTRDELRARSEAQEELSPRYREMVDQYYKALSEEK
ncbi:MAG: hypothetical protein ACOC7T_05085 [Planctomycetota bacterium]